MIRIGLLGSTGRMGREVRALIEDADDLTLGDLPGRGELVAGCFRNSDVVLDFSLPPALEAALPHLGDLPLVTGTTGLSDATQAALDAQGDHAPVLQAANFSVGVNVLLALAERAAASMPDTSVDVIEAHHAGKRDAPSGTALALGAATGHPAVNYHAVRAGDIIGSHQVWFCAQGERIELHHHATDRNLFAAGAIRACKWILGKSAGRYGMADVLGLS